MRFGTDLEVQELNLGVLDELVEDYYEYAAETSEEGPQAVCEQIRDHLLLGHIDDASQLLKTYCPAALEDKSVMFKLSKQKFIEQLRSGTTWGDLKALECARNELAPLAQGAYLEAYQEFKKLLLLLVYKDGIGKGDVAQQWSQESQKELANRVYQTVKQLMGVEEASLASLLCYLCYLHTSYRPNYPDALPEQATVDALLLPGRNPAPFPLPSLQPPSFNYADVQAIMMCTGADRQAATEALKHSGGQVVAAFKSELARLRINTEFLDSLCQEYASYRNLAAAEVSLSELRAGKKRTQAAAAHHGQPADCMGTMFSTGTSIRQNMRAQAEDSISPPSKVPRWQEKATDGSKVSLENTDCNGAGFSTASCSTLSMPAKNLSKEEVVRMLQQSVQDGDVEGIIAKVQEADPEFFKHHPRLLFELKQCRYLSLVEASNLQAALAVARNELSPLASQHPELLTQLKATMACLLPGSARSANLPSLQTVAGSVQQALQKRLGLHAPRLVKLLQVLLAVHKAWVKLEKYTDPFQSILKIDALRQATSGQTPSRADVAIESGPPVGLQVFGGEHFDSSEEGLDNEEEGAGGGVDEMAVLQLMEVLNLQSRVTAMEWLAQHEGNVEAAIMSYFSGLTG